MAEHALAGRRRRAPRPSGRHRAGHLRAQPVERGGARGGPPALGRPTPASPSSWSASARSGRCSSRAAWCATSSPPTRATRSPPTRPTRSSSRPTPRGRSSVEHWSILTFTQRLEAAARGLPAIVTGSLAGVVDGRQRRRSPWPRRPSARSACSPRSSPTSPWSTARWPTEAGNVALSEPLLEGAWGAWAARRGVVATVERVVEHLDGLGHRVRIPAHRVLAVVEAPFGAHPGGLYAPGLPVRSYGEDIAFWTEARDAPRAATSTPGPGTGCSSPPPTRPTSSASGAERLDWLAGAHRPRVVAGRRRGPPRRRRRRRRAPGSTPPPTARARSRPWSTRIDADAVLAGAGVANLAAWVGGRPGPRPGAVPSSSPPSSACWGTGPRRPIPTSSTTASSRARPMLVGRLDRARHGGGGPGHAHRRLPRAPPRSTGTGTSTRR